MEIQKHRCELHFFGMDEPLYLDAQVPVHESAHVQMQCVERTFKKRHGNIAHGMEIQRFLIVG